MEKLVTVSVRMTDALRDELQADAQACDMTQADWMREAVEHYLALDDIQDESESYDFTDYKNLIEHQIEKVEELDDTDDIVSDLNKRFDALKESIEEFDSSPDDFDDDALLDLMNEAQDLLDDCRNSSDDSDETDQDTDEETEE